MNSKTQNNTDILINILTRTSNRPFGFQKCYASVKQQTYPHIRHIVSYDNKSDVSYLNGLGIDTVDVTSIQQPERSAEVDSEGNLYAPYNLYCNKMLDVVEDGWILFLDDDDNLFHNKIIEEIVSVMYSDYNEDCLYIWQMRYPDGRLLPTNVQIEHQDIKKNYIGSPCYLFHSSFKHQARWDSYKASDFRFLQQLLNVIPKKKFLKKVAVQINNFGDLGKKNDLDMSLGPNYKMPDVFYKNWYWSLIPKYHTKILGKLVFHKRAYTNFFLKLFGKSKNAS